ncbi:MAG: glycosyltransferase family 39 protein [Acidobacteria bacterium]|nr:glycosyltransferase family 39 protein [Acidobacteriota bacterium]
MPYRKKLGRLYAVAGFACPLLLVSLLATLLYFPVTTSHDFWAPDEPLFAEVSRHMFRTGKILIPQFAGQPFTYLPPFSYWMIALSARFLGEFNEAAARASVVLFAAMALLSTFVLAARMFTWSVAYASTLILATSALFFHQASWLQSDMILVGLTTLAAAFLYCGLDSQQGWWKWYAGAGLVAGLAVLTKGPLGFLLPSIFLISFWTCAGKRLTHLFLPVVTFSAATAAVSLPWFVLAAQEAGPGFMREVLFKHNVGMLFQSWSHRQPPYYYFLHLPWGFAPWSLVLPAALVHSFRQLKHSSGPGSATCTPDGERGASRHLRGLLLWCVLSIIFFSVMSGKQAKYLLPVYPALAIIVAHFLYGHPGAFPQAARSLRYPALLGGCAMLLLSLSTPFLAWKWMPVLLGYSLLASFLFLALGAPAFWFLYRGKPWGMLTVWTALSVIVSLMATDSFFPLLNEHKSYRRIAGLAAATAGNGLPLAIYDIGRHQTGGILYYSNRPVAHLQDPAQVGHFMACSPDFVLFTTGRSVRKLQALSGTPLAVLAETKIGHRQIALLRPVQSLEKDQLGPE